MVRNMWLQRTLLLLSVVGTAQAAMAITLEDVKEAIKNDPMVRWQAGDTGAAANIGSGARATRFGLIDINQDDSFDLRTDQFETQAGLPKRVDWHNVGGQNFMSPVRNQGRCGSCVAFATAAVADGTFNIAAQRSDLNTILSEQYIFANIGSCDRGAQAGAGVSSLKNTGAPDIACFPYTSGRLGTDQAKTLTCKDTAKRLVKVADYKSVSSTTLKEALTHGPVLTTMTVYEDFMFYTGGVYQHVTGSMQGGHAITIVGYDDDDGAFIVKNSWGEDWGEKGYFRIAYNDDSGLGSSNYKVSADALNVYAKLVEPEYLGAVAGTVTLKALAFNDSLKSITYTLKNLTTGDQKDGAFDLSTKIAQFDSTALKDGTYEITTNATLQNGTVGKPWYSTVNIANLPQKITISLEPDFDNSKAVTGRVYYNIKVAYDQVPLSRVVLNLRQKDGDGKKTVSFDDPGKATKLGWRTASTPNGKWEITVTGSIGNLQQFTSNTLETTVQN